MTHSATVNVLKVPTLVAFQKCQGKQHRPRSDCFWRSSLIRVFLVCYSDKHFGNPALKTNILFENRKRKVFEILEHLPYLFCLFCCFMSQVNSYGHGGTVSSPNNTFSWASLNKRLTSTSCTYFGLLLTTTHLEWFRGREENDSSNYFTINLHESMGPGRDQTCDPWICSQMPICSQTCYRLGYVARYYHTCIWEYKEPLSSTTSLISFYRGSCTLLFLLLLTFLRSTSPSPTCKHSTDLLINTNLGRKIVNICLSISLNICFWCSKEPSHWEWDGSLEYLKHMFLFKNNKKKICTLRPNKKNTCV